jgi:hypothetical protein
MNKLASLLGLAAWSLTVAGGAAQNSNTNVAPNLDTDFDTYFADSTLRLDYLMTGDVHRQAISVDALSQLDGWAGRRQRLAELPLRGNAQLTVRDTTAERRVLYRTSFCTLFQEWLETDEAAHVSRGFEATLLVPYPKQPVDIEVALLTQRGDTTVGYTHRVDPADILIRHKGTTPATPYRYLHQAGTPAECIDVAIIGEGYTEAELETFYADAEKACESLFSYEPFRSLQDRFNIVAVAATSAESGVSVPRTKEWRETAFGAHFSTFYSDRYLTTTHVHDLHDALAGIPYEHIIVLANTEEYGGGGIYNFYTLTAAHHKLFAPVVVHEFGHSFGGLTDEYFYDDDVVLASYPTDVEPWEPNITSLVNFDSKWADMVPKGVQVPTPVTEKYKKEKTPSVGVFEGGGYFAKGIYRPAYDCRMRTNQCPVFCPVCERSLRRTIEFYTSY